MKSLISVCIASNRPYLWNKSYAILKEYSDDVRFEIIFVGPESPDFDLPSNVKYIKTGNIKCPQCNEIAIRNAQGNMLMLLCDDHKFWHGGLDHLYEEKEEACNQQGHNKLVFLPPFRDRGGGVNLTYPGSRGPNRPFSSLAVGALFDRELLSLVGNKAADIRFVGTCWDSDLAMRFQEVGVEFVHSSSIWCVEFKVKDGKQRLGHICRDYDKEILDSFWVLSTSHDNIEDGYEVYGRMCKGKVKTVKRFLSKKRLKEFIGYKDEDILTKSQGPKSVGNLSWD